MSGFGRAFESERDFVGQRSRDRAAHLHECGCRAELGRDINRRADGDGGRGLLREREQRLSCGFDEGG
jgi:hypothetical protein